MASEIQGLCDDAADAIGLPRGFEANAIGESEDGSRSLGGTMELLLKVAAIGVVVCIVAYVLFNHWQERWGENHF
jgi:hypothetical protein